MQLGDVWRALHPDTRDYTFYSHPRQTYTRIDYIFCPHHLLPNVSMADIGVMVLSDHAPVSCSISLPAFAKPHATWKLNESLLLDALCLQELKDSISNFAQDHCSDETTPAIRWEALKCVLRGVLVKHGSRIKRAAAARYNTLIAQLHALESLHKQNRAETVLRKLIRTRHELLAHMKKRYTHYKQLTGRMFYEWGNKAGKLLARSLQAKKSSLFIPSIQTPSGSRTHLSDTIAETFRAYYSSLYSLPRPNPQSLDGLSPPSLIEYIASTALPTLSQEDVQSLECPFSPAELAQAISSLPPGKSPGPDGYTAKFYKVLREELSAPLLTTFNAPAGSSPFPPSFLRAFITVLPKDGKDPSLCPSYRPISLLNTDAKLFAKLIANRLAGRLEDLIHPDQVGFVRNREARDNTLRTFSVIHRASRTNTPLFLLSLDAEKAFDRVDWDFLEATLSQIGLGPVMRARIMSLYCNPQAQVRINGRLSAPFDIKNGTRQGCPLSPLLYVLCMEHLLNAIRQNPDIKGLETPTCHHKYAAFADDLLLYISSPVTSLPSLMATLSRYSSYSNYKINRSKCEALNVTLPSRLEQLLRDSYPFTWRPKSIKYLGIQVPSSLAESFRLNFPPLLLSLGSDLTRWDRKDFSWLGRINILKMNLLPRLLYLFSCVPTHVPRPFLQQLAKLMSGFVWANRHPRIARAILVRRKSEGGLALPDGRAYYLSAVLTRVLDSFHNRGTKQWVELESLDSPVDPRALLWLPGTSLPNSLVSSLPPSLASIALARSSYLRGSSIAPPDGPMSPLFGNPLFPPALQSPSFLGKRRESGVVLGALMETSALKPLAAILGDGVQTLSSSFQYAQLRHFYETSRVALRLHRTLTPFEKLCSAASAVSRPTSTVYGLFLDSFRDTPLPFRISWENAIGRPLADEEWSAAVAMCHKSSISCKAQETNYKLLTRWYRVPALLARFYPSVSDACWRCGSAGGTILHIWITCPLLVPFWSEVLDRIHCLTDTRLPLDPVPLLLSILPPSTPRRHKALLGFLLLAARSVIPRLWRSTVPPTFSSWLQEVVHLHRMEELTADSHRRQGRHLATWAPWVSYVNSPEFLIPRPPSFTPRLGVPPISPTHPVESHPPLL